MRKIFIAIGIIIILSAGWLWAQPPGSTTLVTAANIIAALTGNPLPVAQGGTSASTAAGTTLTFEAEGEIGLS